MTKCIDWWKRFFFVWGSVVLVVASLYFGRIVLIPFILSILLAYILTPLVIWMQRFIGRMASVLVAVACSCMIIAGLGGVIMMQVQSLAGQVPRYKDVIVAKVETVYESSRGAWAEVTDTVNEISDKIKQIDPAPEETAPVPVTIEQTPYLTWLQTTVGNTFGFLVDVGLVIILVTFVLLNREDLRNRFIRLSGTRSLTSTTKALDDMQHRISRYLWMQLVVNASYGAIVGLALFFIQVPYALLWGFLAAVLRYVPYVGPWIAAAFPIVLCVAVFEGWWPLVLVVLMFVVVELFSNNVMETWLYGRSIGVSSIAVLVAAVFWTWVWGPVGLVLSTPLTACLVVLGRYVPTFSFLEVLLGDKPALPTHVTLFQRLLAHDEDEASDLVQEYAAEHPLEEVFDDVLIPVLHRAQTTQAHGDLSDDDVHFIHKAMEQFLDELTPEPDGAPEHDTLEEQRTRVSVIGCPVRDQGDEFAAQMFCKLIDGPKYRCQALSSETLLGELRTHLQDEMPDAVCLFTVPPGGVTRTRMLCRQLRREFPELKILVLCWRKDHEDERLVEQFAQAKASGFATSLLELRDKLNGLLPVLATQAEEQHAGVGSARP